MKKAVISIITLVTLLIIAVLVINYPSDLNGNENTAPIEEENGNGNINENQDKEDNQKIPVKQPLIHGLTIHQINEQPMFSLEDISKKYNFEWKYDPIERTIDIKDDNHVYYLLQGTSVISKDGVYIPNLYEPYVDSEQKVYLVIEMLDEVFELSYEFAIDNQSINVFAAEESNSEENNSSFLEFQRNFSVMTEEDLVSYLSFLSTPLEGAHITVRDSQLPGAPRTYRNGIHEGIDWYSGTTGINVNRNTPILSMADGVVVRADHNYTELSNEVRVEILNIALNIDVTPEYILDKLRGQSVWIQYPNGVLVRYAHLSKIEEGINVGKVVKAGDILAYVGNSGTSYGVIGNDVGLHLHSDILIYDHLFWEHLDKTQIRNVLEKLFPNPTE